MPLALIATSLALAAAPTVPLSPAERLAAARAAGFQIRGTRILNECDMTPERLGFDRQDLNGDGAPELIVTDEGGCYGAAGATFAVLRKGPAGWTAVLTAQGVMVPLKTKHGGWTDIEIGGPGVGKMPVARWNGAKYVY